MISIIRSIVKDFTQVRTSSGTKKGHPNPIGLKWPSDVLCPQSVCCVRSRSRQRISTTVTLLTIPSTPAVLRERTWSVFIPS